MSQPNSSIKPSWTALINESVHTTDDVDIGDIEAVSRGIIVVKRGFVNVHRYYIPISQVEGWDGNVLWLKISEGQVKANYERDKIPDPTKYYIKDYPYYNTAYYPEVIVIEPRFLRTTYPAVPIPTETVVSGTLYVCDLCTASFRNEDDLADHISVQHASV